MAGLCASAISMSSGNEYVLAESIVNLESGISRRSASMLRSAGECHGRSLDTGALCASAQLAQCRTTTKIAASEVECDSWTCTFLLPNLGKARGAVCLKWKAKRSKTQNKSRRDTHWNCLNLHARRRRSDRNTAGAPPALHSLDFSRTYAIFIPFATLTNRLHSERPCVVAMF